MDRARGFLVLVSLLLTTSASASQYKYFSMNLHCALDNWPSRVDQVLDEIARTRPDVAGFQEVCRGSGADMSRYIVDGLNKRGWNVAFSKAVDTHWSFFKYQEQVLIVSRQPVLSYETDGLPSMIFFKNRYIAIQLDGQWVVTTHLHFWLGFIREAQYRVLAKRYTARNAVIMADFNSSADSPEAKPLLRRGWTPYFIGPTFPSDKPTDVYDGFFISPSLSSEVVSAGMRKTFEGGQFPPSDHLAVELTVRYR